MCVAKQAGKESLPSCNKATQIKKTDSRDRHCLTILRPILKNPKSKFDNFIRDFPENKLSILWAGYPACPTSIMGDFRKAHQKTSQIFFDLEVPN